VEISEVEELIEELKKCMKEKKDLRECNEIARRFKGC